MNSFGLSEKDIFIIKEIFNKYLFDLPSTKAFIFGSRSRGDHRPFSDIDIYVKSESLDLNRRMQNIRNDLETSSLPYKVDLSAWSDLFAPYLAQIEIDAKAFWP